MSSSWNMLRVPFHVEMWAIRLVCSMARRLLLRDWLNLGQCKVPMFDPGLETVSILVKDLGVIGTCCSAWDNGSFVAELLLIGSLEGVHGTPWSIVVFLIWRMFTMDGFMLEVGKEGTAEKSWLDLIWKAKSGVDGTSWLPWDSWLSIVDSNPLDQFKIWRLH